jgi:hypothetical protein
MPCIIFIGRISVRRCSPGRLNSRRSLSETGGFSILTGGTATARDSKGWCELSTGCRSLSISGRTKEWSCTGQGAGARSIWGMRDRTFIGHSNSCSLAERPGRWSWNGVPRPTAGAVVDGKRRSASDSCRPLPRSHKGVWSEVTGRSSWPADQPARIHLSASTPAFAPDATEQDPPLISSFNT